jgi:spore cortex biosynthesis protein YabQ
MTDYLYGLSLATQTKSFLLSLGLGFIMGIFYDLFRLIRLAISKSKMFIIIFDLLYCIFLCFATFVFCMTVNEGQIRFYLLMGEAMGFVVYYFSLGVIVFSFGENLVNFTKRWLKRIFTILLFPFKWIFERTKSVFYKILKKGRKRSKNLKNKSKTLLKLTKHLLYNHNVKKQNQVDDDI